MVYSSVGRVFIYESLGSFSDCPSSVWRHTPGRWRQEDEKFRIIFSYIVGLRLAWTTRVPVSNKRTRQ